MTSGNSAAGTVNAALGTSIAFPHSVSDSPFSRHEGPSGAFALAAEIAEIAHTVAVEASVIALATLAGKPPYGGGEQQGLKQGTTQKNQPGKPSSLQLLRTPSFIWIHILPCSTHSVLLTSFWTSPGFSIETCVE